MVSFEKAVSEQLCKIQDELRKIRILNELQEARDIGVVYIAIPESGATRSFSTGTTVIDFLNGKIKNPDGSVDELQISLQRLAKDFLHSLSITSDQDIVLQIGTQNKRTVEANLGLELPYLTYKEISITTTATTNISIYASTNPFSTVNGNTVSIMKGQNAGSLVTIAVDASGNIIGVLKGDYGGTLKTLATDDSGRLLAKIYDPQNIFGVNNVVGFAELANRVNAPLMRVMSGNIIWYDNFDSPVLKWKTAIQGTGAGVYLTTQYCNAGVRSCKLVTGNATNDYAKITRGFSAYGTTKIAIECAYAVESAQTKTLIELHISRDDGATLYKGAVRFRPQAGDFDYLDSTGTWQNVMSIYGLARDPYNWYHMKLVLDFSTNKYSSYINDERTYTFSNKDLRSLVTSGTRQLLVDIIATTEENVSKTAYIDNAVVTVNEA